ncbi:MAG TPA: trehalose-6-phosphate synthase, partial [Terriglobales bacterium]|nr:trehalose-6-phosphate synthase [Terriglobales bacterium]
LQRRGGKWIGWAGAQLTREARARLQESSYEMLAVDLAEVEVGRYYHGLSNRTLWPLFHCFPDLARFNQVDWEAYASANDKFAALTVEAADTDSLIWVHDYHLMLAPRTIRRALPQSRLAFFLHIPFPPYDIFRLLPWSNELLRGVLACDLVGFHVDNYTRNFLDCCELLLGARVDRNNRTVHHAGRSVRVGAFPIGIDFDYYETLALKAPPAGTPREQLVIGVDRLDYTKGIPERLLVFERLLELYPQHRERVIFLQLAVPSRAQVAEYRQLKRQIDELVGRINGRFSTATWSPIRYLYQSMPSERLTGLYRDADVALVTPGRDGMNLVAKEFVASQVDKPGVLILSRLAGAAETMAEAILVNPYDLEGTAQALHRALTMEEAERRTRLGALRQRERRANVTWWVEQFLAAAHQASQIGERPDAKDFERWFGNTVEQKQLALFLDYDLILSQTGSVQPHTLAELRKALEQCLARGDMQVGIVSGRPLRELTAELGDESGLILIASHGLEIGGVAGDSFMHEDALHYRERIARLERELHRIATAGARVNHIGVGLQVIFANTRRRDVAAQLEQVRAAITRAGFQARDLPRGVEARVPIPWNAGHAIMHAVRHTSGPDWSERVRIVYIGDDASDEETFHILAGLGITLRVGTSDTVTAASRQLPDVENVLSLLQWIGQRQPKAANRRLGSSSNGGSGNGVDDQAMAAAPS